MKNFHCGGKQRLFMFTEKLSELIASGISLQKALFIIAAFPYQDKKLSDGAAFLHSALLGGTKFSVALKMLPSIPVPEWYIAYITVAEECACIGPVLAHLRKMLCHERERGRKCLEAMLYPMIVIFLTAFAGFFFVFAFLPQFSLLFGGKGDELKIRAAQVLLYANTALLSFFLFLFIVVRKMLAVSPCLNVFRTMAFLSQYSVPTLTAVSCAFSFSEREKSVASALLAVRKALLEGELLSTCFGDCFQRSGFKLEGIILSENLLLSQETGKSDGFEKTAAYFSERQKNKERIFLSLLQPLMLLIAAAYITVIIKTAFLPYLIESGGFV